MKRPLVTIAIISYNYSDYIVEAINSALRQTYENIEIILIDDGSTDNTLEKLQPYQSLMKIISNPHKGLIATRNDALHYAKGDFIIQLDADDYLANTYVEKTVTEAMRSGADIIYTQAKVFGRVEFETSYIAYDREKLKHDNYIHAASLVRKKYLKERQYDQYLEDKGYEDWDLFLDMCMDGATASLVDEALLYYRKHLNKKSRSDELLMHKDILARHHIWEKQNKKHPEEFWYFSSQISILLEAIRLYESIEEFKINNNILEKRNERLESKNNELASRIALLEKRDTISLAKKVLQELRYIGKKR